MRIIVDSIADCYKVLGIVHSEYTPLPLRFKDYIAVPKPNMYQSLHTTIMGKEGKIFEIQIRTFDMDSIAELGIAAHWAYKENSNYSHEQEQIEITNKLKWYKDLSTYIEMSENEDPLNNIIEDIFSANVYVFTPNGDVLDMPKGAMPLDFAYRIHSNVGDKTVGAIVNGKIVPLSYKLKTGDVVQIKTNKSILGPTKEWLKNAKTTHARHKIKAAVNKRQRDLMIELGLAELEKVSKVNNYNLKQLEDQKVIELFGKNNIKSVQDLTYDIGKGILSPTAVINKILGINNVKYDDESFLELYKETEVVKKPLSKKSSNGYGIVVEGLDKVQIKLGNCCQPVYGDLISGYITKGHGIVVHREGCPNIQKQEEERFINIYWDRNFQGKIFDAMIKIYALDKKNLVANMINSLNATKVNIVSVSSNKNKIGENITKFKLQVANIDDLNHAILTLNKISEIYKIERVFK